MQSSSRPVTSNQPHVNERLPQLVARHLASEFRKPVAAHNRAAFELLERAVDARTRPLVLDSFCGTGHSTALLARRHPEHLVVGIDKSAYRLARHIGEQGDYLLLQAECEDIWQLLLQRGLRVEYHYLLYPNPWPKAKQLQRRVHGHPGFPWLLQLGGQVELRSNWQTYVEEFGLALHLAGQRACISRVEPNQPLTLFERKYRDSGHDLWRCTCRILQGPGAVPGP